MGRGPSPYILFQPVRWRLAVAVTKGRHHQETELSRPKPRSSNGRGSLQTRAVTAVRQTSQFHREVHSSEPQHQWHPTGKTEECWRQVHEGAPQVGQRRTASQRNGGRLGVWRTKSPIYLMTLRCL